MYVGCKTLFLVGASQRYPDFDEDDSEVGPLTGYACYGFSEGCKMPVKLLYRTRDVPVPPGTILAVTGSLMFEYPNIVLGSTAIHRASAVEFGKLDFHFVPRVHIDGNIRHIVQAERDGEMTTLTFDCVVHGPVDTVVRCQFKHRDSDLPIIRKNHKVSLVGAVSGHAEHLVTVKVFSFGCILYPGHIGRRDALYYPDGAQTRKFTVVGVYLPLNDVQVTPVAGADALGGGHNGETDIRGNTDSPLPTDPRTPFGRVDQAPFVDSADSMLNLAPDSSRDPAFLRLPESSFPFDPSVPGAAQKYFSSADHDASQFLSATSALATVDPSFIYSTPCTALRSPGPLDPETPATDVTVQGTPAGKAIDDELMADNADRYGLYAGPEDYPLAPTPADPQLGGAGPRSPPAVVTTSQDIPFDYYESFADDLLPADAFDINGRVDVSEYYETAVYMD